MRNLLWVALVLSACASQRRPSSYGDDSYQSELKSWLPAGTYKGTIPGGSKGCTIRAQYDLNFSVDGNEEGFNFEHDRGSQRCMYNQACFVLGGGGDLSPEVLEHDSTEDHFLVQVSARGGESGAKSKMKVEIERLEGRSMTVTVEESVGLAHLLTSRVRCQIR